MERTESKDELFFFKLQSRFTLGLNNSSSLALCSIHNGPFSSPADLLRDSVISSSFSSFIWFESIRAESGHSHKICIFCTRRFFLSPSCTVYCRLTYSVRSSINNVQRFLSSLPRSTFGRWRKDETMLYKNKMPRYSYFILTMVLRYSTVERDATNLNLFVWQSWRLSSYLHCPSWYRNSLSSYLYHLTICLNC